MDDAPSGDRELPEPVRHVPAEVVGGGVAELLTHVLGVDWTVSLLAPAMTAVARTVWEADRRQWQQAAEAVKVAADDLGGADLVREHALADPARTELFRRVVQAAGRSTLREKIPALGRVLAIGLPAGDRVDEALILAAALGDLEAPHINVLEAIRREGDEMKPDERRLPRIDRWISRMYKRLSLPYSTSQDLGVTRWKIAAELPGHFNVMAPVIQTLALHGLIEDVSSPGQPHWFITKMGRACLDLIRESATG